MRRGWVDGWSPFFPAKEQREALEASGVKPIYEAGRDNGITEFLRAMRRNDTVVVFGMNALARTVDEYDNRVADITARGIKIEDLLTGSTFDPAGVLPYATGRSRILTANRVKSKKEARRRGKLGGKPALPPVEDMKKAKAIWRDKSIDTNEEAAALIGRTPYWCRRYLGGSSGRPKGFDKARR